MPKCPACGALLGVVAKPHCKSQPCGWVICDCRTTIDVVENRYYSVAPKEDA